MVNSGLNTKDKTLVLTKIHIFQIKFNQIYLEH